MVAKGARVLRNLKVPMLWQLVLAFVPLAVTAIAIDSMVGYGAAADAVRQQALRQLQTVRDNKRHELQRLLHNLEDQVVTLARNPSSALAVKQFATAVHDLDSDPQTEPDRLRPQLESVKEFIEDYYRGDLVRKAQPLTGLVPTQRSAVWLQAAYVANNPNPSGKKQLLENARDGTRYAGYHTVWHPVFRTASEAFGFQDLYLIDANTGRVLYSVAKSPDFQATLADGPYGDSNLGLLFRRLQTEPREGNYVMFDWAPYVAVHGKPAAFAGAPIYDNGQKTGILIVQLSIDSINDIMTADHQWEQVGLGTSGEAYIIGRRSNDLLMRSESRFYNEIKDANAAVATAGTAVLSQRVQSTAALTVADAAEYHGRYMSYRGIPVVGASGQLHNLHGLDWTVIAEISEAEALAPLAGLRNFTIGLASMLVAGFLVAALVVSVTLSRPARILAATVRDIQTGNYRARAHVRTRNELGLLADGLNQLLDERVGALVKADEEHRRLQSEIRGLLAVVAAASDNNFSARAVAGTGPLGNLANALNLMLEHLGLVIDRLRGVSARVLTAANQIGASADQLAEGAARQTVDIAGTTAAVQDMSAAIESVRHDAAIAAETAKQSEDAAQVGGDAVKRVFAGIDVFHKDTRAAAVTIKRLGERSMEISTITAAIQTISAHIHMLALNAAIEASRAGAHGLGFTAVADEVRELAEQTEATARDVAELIAAIQSETNDAVAGMERQAESLEEHAALVCNADGRLDNMLAASTQSTALIAQISRSTEDQAQTATRIGEAMRSIAEAVRRARESSQQTQQRSAGLIEAAVELNEHIAHFHVPGEAPAGTAGDSAPHPPVPPGNGHAVAHSSQH